MKLSLIISGLVELIQWGIALKREYIIVALLIQVTRDSDYLLWKNV